MGEKRVSKPLQHHPLLPLCNLTGQLHQVNYNLQKGAAILLEVHESINIQ